MYHEHPLTPRDPSSGDAWSLPEPVKAGDFFDGGSHVHGGIREVTAVLFKADWPGYRIVESRRLPDAEAAQLLASQAWIEERAGHPQRSRELREQAVTLHPAWAELSDSAPFTLGAIT